MKQKKQHNFANKHASFLLAKFFLDEFLKTLKNYNNLVIVIFKISNKERVKNFILWRPK